SEDEYISRAVMLAEDRELLAGLQKSIRSMMQKSPLMDSRLYLQEMEAAYTDAWEKYESGQRK
nr:UDP-N-acetylglucosamine-peptide N-acetylglucosaminyltransferase [Schwartzia sp. (in: firmicutes)]